MRKLFIKFFLWFWLTMTLVGAILVILALTTDHQAAEYARHVRRFTPYGNQLVLIYEEQGMQALAAEMKRLQKKEGAHMLLYHEDTGPLTDRPLPPRFKKFLDRAGTRNTLQPNIDEARQRSGRREKLVVIPLDRGYRLLVNVPPPTRLEYLLDPRALTLRLAVTFLVAGIVCYLLARSLTAPISKLRKAAQELAAGNLTTRVVPTLGRQSDEIADLARDFDRMAERIEILLQSQQQLLRDISHELRSPLARLNVALGLARQRSAAEARTPLDRIEKEAERLNNLIGQLLTLTQLECRPEILDPQPIDLLDFLEKIVQDANYEAQNRNRSVSLLAAKNVVINGSVELLHRAVENVIRNALWYTAEGTEVEISLDTFTDQGLFALIAVRDHGPGVPEKALADLFRPFYRVAEARDRQSGGTGVGLAIAWRAVRLHGGRITAANVESGLEVRIFLPCEQDRT